MQQTTIAIKERPILFSTKMVQAILRGQKTQTRRIIKPKPTFAKIQELEILDVLLYETMLSSCPYGKVGDRLWVRETWATGDSIYGQETWWYKADSERPQPPSMEGKDFRWKPSIHMPKELCRLRLDISDIKIQRLQEISDEEAISEGIEIIEFDDERMYRNYSEIDICLRNPIASFCSLWESINGINSWSVNPWIWVINFHPLI